MSCWKTQVQYVNLAKGQYGLLDPDTEDSGEDEEDFLGERTLRLDPEGQVQTQHGEAVVEDEY